MTEKLKRLAADVRYDQFDDDTGTTGNGRLDALLEAVEALQGVYVPREVLAAWRRALALGLQAEEENIPQPSTRAAIIGPCIEAIDALLTASAPKP